jgi:hypothetical protein
LDKKGPFKDAFEQGGKTDFDKSGMSLKDFISTARPCAGA